VPAASTGLLALRAAAGVAARAVTTADAVCGVLPGLVLEPESVDQVAAVLVAASGNAVAVVPRGSGSELEWGDPPPREFAVLSTRRLTGVLDHAAADMVVVARAGTTLDELQRAVGATRQRLALDPPDPGATLGGIVAANAAGPLRLRYGRPRDLLIGVQAVLPDGTTARAGGRVVKNVAGYDLGKLYAGSFGTLGVIVETTFRLHPLPASSSVTFVETRDEASAVSLAESVIDSPLEAASASLHWSPEGPHRLRVRLEGSAAGVSARSRVLDEIVAATAGAEPAAGEAAPPMEAAGVLRLGFRPGDLGLVLAELRSVAEGAPVWAAVEPGIGSADAHVSGEAGALSRFVSRLRERLAGWGHVHLRRAPPEVRRAVGTWDERGLPLALLGAVKRRFDPAGILAPGRMPGNR
jgi:glycolate oxidase FAD binding subunit